MRLIFHAADGDFIKFKFCDTDPEKWHLHVENGRQTWYYNQSGSEPQSAVSKYWLGIPSDEEVEVQLENKDKFEEAAGSMIGKNWTN